MSELLAGGIDTLRYHPTAKRIRACLGGEPVADTDAAVLVWEPRRIVPTYAVPRAAVTAQLVPAGADSGDDEIPGFRTRRFRSPHIRVRATVLTSSPAKRRVSRQRSNPPIPTWPTT